MIKIENLSENDLYLKCLETLFGDVTFDEVDCVIDELIRRFKNENKQIYEILLNSFIVYDKNVNENQIIKICNIIQ